MARMSKARRAEQLFKRLGDPKDLNYDAIFEMIKLAKLPNMKPEFRLKIAEIIMQYVYPKQKAIEVDQNQGQAVTFNFDLSGEQERTTKDNFNLSGEQDSSVVTEQSHSIVPSLATAHY